MKSLLRVNIIVACLSGLILAACSGDSGFSLNGESSSFRQSVTQTQVKVDILWVVDNSGSMETSQAEVANNFQSFIDNFQQSNFDFQMAVTTTDAWTGDFINQPELARFRDGTEATSYTGVTVINPSTANLGQTFVTNIIQGTEGSGDERGWQSMKAALEYQPNRDEPFPRQDALLAVIFLTDEDDFSNDTIDNISQGYDAYNDPLLHDTQMYYDYLYNLTKSTDEKLNFTVHTIGIFDEECLNTLNTVWTGRKIARRYAEITDLTNGYKGSLCEPFSDVMSGIADSIVEKSTGFVLSRQPVLSSLVVTIDGVVVPMDPVNGWTYDEATLVLSFHGSYVPNQDSIVEVAFDPAGLK